MELKIGDKIPDRDVLLMDPFFWRFYKMKESQVEKVQKELNEKMLNSVISYDELIEIISEDLTPEQKEHFWETRRTGWVEDYARLGEMEQLIREQTIAEDGTIIIRFLKVKVSPDEDEEEP